MPITKFYLVLNFCCKGCFHNQHIWTPANSGKGPIKEGLSILLCGHFLQIISLVIFLNSGLVLETYKLCVTGPDFSEKNLLPPKSEKWTNSGAKSLVINFYWICSIMKIYIFCCAPAQIPYLGKFCSWDMGQNVLSQSDCRNQSTNHWNSLIFCMLIQIHMN